jgi:hydroxylaminobenzene mutase
MAVPILKNPRMGVASHLQGMTNGPFLVVVGLMWPYLQLPHAWEIVTVVLLVYGTYANWLATQLGSLWGAGHRFAPGATGEHRATAAQERVVDVLLASLAPAMVVATVLLGIGVLR